MSRKIHQYYYEDSDNILRISDSSRVNELVRVRTNVYLSTNSRV